MNDTISYTPEEVAKILKITRYTVYEMIKRGDLSAYRIGRKVRVEAPDLENYIKKSKGFSPAAQLQIEQTADVIAPESGGLVICGQDATLDTLTRYLEKEMPRTRFLRNYVGSMDGLMALYHRTANVVTAHLWDRDTNEYNIPYIRRILPGQRTIIINLVYRMAGFYVAKGNPLTLNDWPDLARSGLRLANREPGSGARVLLDEKLRELNIDYLGIDGYYHEEMSHLAVASCVARGEADVGVGIEKAAMQVAGIDFVPLQRERYDLIIRKEDSVKPEFQALLKVIKSNSFRSELSGLGGYDLTHTGEIVSET